MSHCLDLRINALSENTPVTFIKTVICIIFLFKLSYSILTILKDAMLGTCLGHNSLEGRCLQKPCNVFAVYRYMFMGRILF